MVNSLRFRFGVAPMLLAAAAAMGGAVVPAAHGALIHQYTFNDGTANDSVGSANGTAVGTGTTFSNGQVAFTASAPGSNYINLPAANIDISSYTAASFSIWFTLPTTPAVNSQLFSLGGSNIGGNYGYGYIMATANNGGATPHYRVLLSAGPSTENGNQYGNTTVTGGLTSTIVGNGQHELVVTDDNTTLSLYLDGTLQSSAAIPTKNLFAGLADSIAYVGKSAWPADPGLAGSVNEFDIYNTALNATDVSNSFAAGPVPTPEPATLGILAFGAIGLLLLKRKTA